MIAYIKVNAAHPNMPLAPLYAFAGSPSSVRILKVPKGIGSWKIDAVAVAFTRPDNSITTVSAVNVAGCWVATLPASDVSGRCDKGFQIEASGIDENGNAVTGYVLGVGDVTILSRDVAATSDGTRYYLHYVAEQPDSPNPGDMCYIDGVLKWFNGTAWQLFTDVVAPSTDATTGQAADAKATGDALADRPTKAQLDVGWWSEWSLSQTTYDGSPIELREGANGAWGVWIAGTDNRIGDDKGDSTSCRLQWNSVDSVFADADNFTATRHRVAAPVPTKTSDLTNDGAPDGGSPYASENYVNTSVATNTANFLGTFDYATDLGFTPPASSADVNNAAIAAALPSAVSSPTNNDYVFVVINYTATTPADEFRRFKFDASATVWRYEYTLNSASFTPAQWAAINSGITGIAAPSTSAGSGVAAGAAATAAAIATAVPYSLATVPASGQLADREVQIVTLSAASTTLILPALANSAATDFVLDVINGYEESSTPAAAAFTLSGTIGTNYNIVVPDGEDFAEMTSFAASEMAELYFTRTAFNLGNLPTWKVVKQKVVQFTPAQV